ncbi:hypothetical protein [Leclercia sp. UBA1284]|uniref:hypothetical protein n=1 Tax=Leclercia sp. UBA1284 TaxID=1946737 RepID=UPI00257F91A1|nr:hypothetical protein [Leclercia sp. UBA1284]
MMTDLKLSVLFGIAARLLTFFNQVLSVPLTIALIGLSEFTRYNVMTAGIAWLITLGGCLLPSVVGDISRARSDNNIEGISEKVSSALTLMLLFCLVIALLYVVIYHDLSIEYHTLMFLTLLILFSSTSENIRQGLGENFKNSIYNGFSNLLSLACILALYNFKINTNLLIILIITIGSTALFKFANLLPLFRLFSLVRISYHSCTEMMRKALGFVLISIAYYLNNAGVVTILGYLKFDGVTEFVILQKIILIVMGVVVMIRNPLWGIIASSKYKGHGSTIYKQYLKVLKLYACLSIIIFLFFYCFLSPFIKIWAGGVHIDNVTLIVFSIYVVVIMVSYINSVLYYGLELFGKVSKLLVAEAIINFVSVVIIAQHNLELSYIFSVMIVTSIIINGFIFSLIKRTCLNV